jgi:hypothetical protein
VKWPPACEDVILGAEERPLLEDGQPSRAVGTVTKNTSICVIVICKVQLRVVC